MRLELGSTWRSSASRASSAVAAWRWLPSLDALFLAPRRAASGTTAGAASACRFLQAAVARGHLGLLLELVEVGVQLAQDVFDARQVLARVLEPVLGLAAALLVLADAGGLFQEQAQFLGLATR
jgi:hypothetical protein